ncbi:MAG: type II toxin-antitoxin system HicA family toxin [Spirochaetaceae bacterium]|jgi:predicted RNA binding protein YcfA (HicA-like mRNA interferase family)|nr:type II toxin-antitoxin system HicA family toxin [Spirochaetaceae bacterium]
MKREKVLEKIAASGAVFVRHGKKHDIYENPRTHEYTQVPRHPDVNEYTAKDIIKKMSK